MVTGSEVILSASTGGNFSSLRQRLTLSSSVPTDPGKEKTPTSVLPPPLPGTTKLPRRMLVGANSCQAAGVVQRIGAELTGMSEAGIAASMPDGAATG